MYKLYAYWSRPKPEDIEVFEQYYLSTHVPRAAVLPELVELTATVAEGLPGMEPASYRIAVMTFADRAALLRCIETPEWAEMRQCSGEIISRFGISLALDLGTEVKCPLG